MRISRLFLTAALLIGVLVPTPAQAAATFPRIDASGFQLVSGDTFATYGARVAQLETKPPLAPVGVTEVLAASNRTGRQLCHATYLSASLNPQGILLAGRRGRRRERLDPAGRQRFRRRAAGRWCASGRRRELAQRGDTAIRVSFLDLAT